MRDRQDTDNSRDEKPLGRISDRQPRPKSKAARTAKEVITGDILENSRLRRWYPFALYCIFLIFLYIGHTFNFQRLQRIEMQQRLELNNERSRAMVFSSMRMNASRHSRIIDEVHRRGIPLEESTMPPKKVE